jgi:hypothetical protein
MFTMLLPLWGCADLFVERTFTREMDNDPDGLWVADQDFPVVPGDTGKAYRNRRDVLSRTPATLEAELDQKLQKLTEQEYAEFMNNTRYMETTSEKIYYLDLPSVRRSEYISDKKESSAAQRLGILEIRDSRRENQDISVGMNKQEVVELWGRPSKIDIAGNPRLQNERWTFMGNGAARYVYFESGSVQGWGLDP